MLTVFVVVVACLTPISKASNPEVDPALSEWQNVGACFMRKQVGDIWYNLYRNYQYDPFLGGDCKCFAIKATSPYSGNSMSYNMYYRQNGTTVKQPFTVQAVSTPGYNVPNAAQVPRRPDPPLVYPAVYTECDSCVILRTPANNGTGCILYAMDPSSVSFCCQFVYALLCGPQKYTCYDPKTCPSGCSLN